MIPDHIRARQAEKRRRQRARFFEGKTCVRCGSGESLELDHIDPKLKVSHRIWLGAWETILAETAKCQVLCRDCHIEKTWGEDRGRAGCGTLASYRRGCRCDECRGANAEKNRRQRAERRAQGRVVQ